MIEITVLFHSSLMDAPCHMTCSFFFLAFSLGQIVPGPLFQAPYSSLLSFPLPHLSSNEVSLNVSYDLPQGDMDNRKWRGEDLLLLCGMREREREREHFINLSLSSARAIIQISLTHSQIDQPARLV